MEKRYLLELVSHGVWRIVLEKTYDSGHNHKEVIQLVYEEHEGEAIVDKLNQELG